MTAAQSLIFPRGHAPHVLQCQARKHAASAVRNCKTFGGPSVVRTLTARNCSADALRPSRTAPIPFAEHHCGPFRSRSVPIQASTINTPCSGVGKSPIPDPHRSVFVLLLVEKARQSSRTAKLVSGKWVNLNHGSFLTIAGRAA